MDVVINGKTGRVDQEGVTVTELLKLREVESPDMVSVQLNGEILERAEFDTKTIQSGDKIEFLYFMGGGAPA